MSTKTRGRKKMQRSKKLGNLYSFSVRLNNRDSARLNSMIEESGMKTATYIREIILDHLDGSNTTSITSSSNSNVDLDQVFEIVKMLYNANVTVK